MEKFLRFANENFLRLKKILGFGNENALGLENFLRFEIVLRFTNKNFLGLKILWVSSFWDLLILGFPNCAPKFRWSSSIYFIKPFLVEWKPFKEVHGFRLDVWISPCGIRWYKIKLIWHRFAHLAHINFFLSSSGENGVLGAKSGQSAVSSLREWEKASFFAPGDKRQQNT